MAKCRFTFEDGPNGELRILGEADPTLDMTNLPSDLSPAQHLFVSMASVMEAEADNTTKFNDSNRPSIIQES